MVKNKNKLELKVGEEHWIREDREYKGAFMRVTVVGETSRSWVICPSNCVSDQKAPYDLNHWQIKFNSYKIPLSGKGWEFGNDFKQQKVRWALDNQWRISQAVERCNNENLLLIVALALNHFTLEQLPANIREDMEGSETWQRIKSACNN